MKNKKQIILLILGFLLTACNVKNTENSVNDNKIFPTDIETETSASISQTTLPTPTNTPVPTPTPTADQIAIDYFNSLEKKGCTDIISYVNEEKSIRNSNLLNYGYITYDEDGNLYYVNQNDLNIYMSKSDGSSSQLLGGNGNAWGWLQLEGEWLYYSDKDSAINRVHLNTGDTERLFGENSGSFIVDNGKIHFEDKENGFVSANLDGKEKEVIYASNGYLDVFTMGENFWISGVYGTSMNVYNLRYLVMFDGEKEEVLYQRGYNPLLVGRYLCITSSKTQELHIYDLETKKEFNLGEHIGQAVVSDGTTFYYQQPRYNGSVPDVVIYCWDGKKSEELLLLENKRNVFNIFLTKEKLYYQLSELLENNKLSYQLWYYDLATGETGQIY